MRSITRLDLARDQFDAPDSGKRVTRFPTSSDNEGLRVDQLPDKILLVYVTPAHQFPTGQGSRRAILEDDYDSDFTMTRA